MITVHPSVQHCRCCEKYGMSHRSEEVVAVVLAITFSILQLSEQFLVIRCKFMYLTRKVFAYRS